MNDIIGWSKLEYARHKKKITGDVALCVRGKLEAPVAVMIDWYEPNDKRDPDNIMAGQKFILDAITAKEVIEDDDQHNIRSITHRFHIDAANPRVEVEVYEVTTSA